MAIGVNKKDNINVDIERVNINKNGELGMQENPDMRWAFTLKVYSIICLQLLLTFGVALSMSLIHPVREFLGTFDSFYVLIATTAVTLIFLKLMICFSERHPWNYILLLLFTLAFSFMIGAASTQIHGEMVLLAAGLKLFVMVGLTLFTFVAAERGWDFGFLWPYLFCALLLFLAIGVLRICFPMGKIVFQVLCCIEALVFCGLIIFGTDNLIKRFNYDQHIEALISLFLDFVNLFPLAGALCGRK